MARDSRSQGIWRHSSEASSSPYSPPEDINELLAVQRSSSPVSVGDTPGRSTKHIYRKQKQPMGLFCFAYSQETGDRAMDQDMDHNGDEEYSPPPNISTMDSTYSPSDLFFNNGASVDASRLNENHMDFTWSTADPQPPKIVLRDLLDCLCTGTSSIDISTDPTDWPALLLSMELTHGEMRDGLVHLAKRILRSNDGQAECQGVMTGSPLKVVLWEEIARDADDDGVVGRMSSMVIRSGILQGMRTLKDLTEYGL